MTQRYQGMTPHAHAAATTAGADPVKVARIDELNRLNHLFTSVDDHASNGRLDQARDVLTYADPVLASIIAGADAARAAHAEISRQCGIEPEVKPPTAADQVMAKLAEVGGEDDPLATLNRLIETATPTETDDEPPAEGEDPASPKRKARK